MTDLQMQLQIRIGPPAVPAVPAAGRRQGLVLRPDRLARVRGRVLCVAVQARPPPPPSTCRTSLRHKKDLLRFITIYYINK